MNSKGYTLIETVTATGLVTMITLCLLSILIYSMNGWSHGVTTNTSSETVSMAMQRLSNEVRDGKSASVSGSILTVTYPAKVTDQTTGDTIYDLSSTANTTKSFLLSSSKLIERVGTTDRVIARNIDQASFSVAGGSVAATLRGFDTAGRKTATQQINTRITLRNYRQ